MKTLIIIFAILLTSCSPQKFTFSGRAQNAEYGAIINQNGRFIYLDDVTAWPEDMLGKTVKVTGIMANKEYTKPSKLSHELDIVIEKPVWNVVSEQ